MSSSDEAPEEVTFNEAKLSTRLNEKRKNELEADTRRLNKQKRRERDQFLKEQQQSTKRKLLSEILKESENDDNSDSDNEYNGQRVKIDTQKRSAAQKKTFEERDGFRIQVAEKPSRVTKKKRLPPAGVQAVKRKEQFLFRESVPRR